jgi:hypothetical protein
MDESPLAAFEFSASQEEIDSLVATFQDAQLPEKFNSKKMVQAMNEIQPTQNDLTTSQAEVIGRTASPQALRFATEFKEKLLAMDDRPRSALP